MKNPRISVAIPFHWMDNWPVLLTRCLASIEAQSFKDYEIVLVKHSTMPVTSNRVIESAKGELVKVLYMDDYLAHGNALQEISDNFKKDDTWLVTGCVHDDGNTVGNYHEPKSTLDISTGSNGIGSPSVLTMRRERAFLFDSRLSWLLDIDLYQRLHSSYGSPKILNTPNVVIGLHKGQMTNILSDQEKEEEHRYLARKGLTFPESFLR